MWSWLRGPDIFADFPSSCPSDGPMGGAMGWPKGPDTVLVIVQSVVLQ